MTGELIPEPFITESGTFVAPRAMNQRRPPRTLLDPAGLDDPEELELAWVRHVTTTDLTEQACYGEMPSDRCGHECGCFVITTRRDPRRVQAVWTCDV